MEENEFVLTPQNYYTKEASDHYLSFHDYLDFAGGMKTYGCEARAMAKMRGEWKDEITLPLLVGGYCDAYFEGSLDEWKNEHPECFTTKGELKAPYKQAEKMIARCLEDELFMKAMTGEKQKIITFFWEGVWWRAKLDVYSEGKFITDFKTTAKMHEAFRIEDYGYVSFVEAYFYTGQLALYQKGIEILYGKKLPCYIAAIEKSDNPEPELINIDQTTLDRALNEIRMNLPTVMAVRNGEVEPVRCGRCAYCKATKKILKPISLMDLIQE